MQSDILRMAPSATRCSRETRNCSRVECFMWIKSRTSKRKKAIRNSYEGRWFDEQAWRSDDVLLKINEDEFIAILARIGRTWLPEIQSGPRPESILFAHVHDWCQLRYMKVAWQPSPGLNFHLQGPYTCQTHSSSNFVYADETGRHRSECQHIRTALLDIEIHVDRKVTAKVLKTFRIMVRPVIITSMKRYCESVREPIVHLVLHDKIWR